jgi:tetratricopeptide (TPR) repeat protein
MHEQALEIRESCTHINSTDLGQSYANLATTLHQLGNNEGASQRYKKAISILENSLSNDRETFAIACSNYALLMRNIGKKRKAISIEKRAQKLLRKQT